MEEIKDSLLGQDLKQMQEMYKDYVTIVKGGSQDPQENNSKIITVKEEYGIITEVL